MNWTTRRGTHVANDRVSGVVDMAMAMREGRHVCVATSVERPACVPLGLDENVLRSHQPC